MKELRLTKQRLKSLMKVYYNKAKKKGLTKRERYDYLVIFECYENLERNPYGKLNDPQQDEIDKQSFLIFINDDKT